MNYGKTQQMRNAFRQISLPTTFVGTVKLHGTNAGVRYEKGVITPMSRNRMLDASGHFGFPLHIRQNEAEILTLFQQIQDEFNIHPDERIEIFGEWVGKGVIKGAAICQLETKRWFVFAASVGINHDGDTEDVGMPEDLRPPKRWLGVSGLEVALSLGDNIFDYPTFELTIDPDSRSAATFEASKLTLAIEEQCPVAAAYQIKGVGEGIVWTKLWDNGARTIFKTKGAKHSETNVKAVKELSEADLDRMDAAHEFAQATATSTRVRQAMHELQATSRTNTSDVIRWVGNDIRTEERDLMIENGIDWQDMARQVATRTREIFFSIIDGEAFRDQAKEGGREAALDVIDI